MNFYTQKNKKRSMASRLAKGILCFILVLCPIILNMSVVAHAEEKQKDNYILDIDEGKVWAEEIGRGDGSTARQSMSIERLRYNYNDSEEFNTIDWEIIFNKNKEYWSGLLLYALLPKTDPKLTMVTREDKYWNKVDNLNVYSDFNGGSRRWGYDNPSAKFNSEYTDNFQATLQGTPPGSNMNAWRDLGRISRVIISGEGRNGPGPWGNGDRYIWRITTYHTKDVALENVPMFAAIMNSRYGHKRVAGIGPFGIASFHELKVPNTRVYVDDIDNITENDKKRIYDRIRKDVDEVIATKSGQDQINYKKEEDEARVEIMDNTYVKTFSDGSKLKLSLKSFVRQRELNVLNQYNEVNWKDSVDIALGINDPDFKNSMVALPAEGKLPAGLGWDQSVATEDVPNGKILGIPDVDWSKVSGTEGSKQVTFKFNIALRKEDGSINKRSETYKPITIVVRQDQGAVPVGVEDFPVIPFVILSMVAMSAIAIFFWRRCIRQE